MKVKLLYGKSYPIFDVERMLPTTKVSKEEAEVDLAEELWDEFNQAIERFYAVQEKLEELHREAMQLKVS